MKVNFTQIICTLMLVFWLSGVADAKTTKALANTMATVVKSTQVESPSSIYQKGKASFYSGYKKTANGERFSPSSFTAAHKTLPFGTLVQVSRADRLDIEPVVVRINNRGPFIKGRVIDVTPAVADALKMRSQGVAPVQLQLINNR